ncbi:hypothetical protein OH76DRAFT_1411496 [Lentinus brumalis]|uniref:Fungal-type protein kinase domain-containing protein n=2 Tax=Polyporaceae TaxID=5317 RepID=A0A371CP92_9APHY|nr:hypothetical protein OH76DRAFT_1411496 [Polyporus brumalis]
MKDCPDTTVLMRLRQFQEVELYNLAADFDKVHALKKKGHRSDKAHDLDANHNLDKTGHDLDDTHTLDGNHDLDKTGLHTLDASHTLDATHDHDLSCVDANRNADATGHNLDDMGHDTYDSKPLPYVNQVWWAFHAAVGSMPKGANLKDATWNTVSEKDLSKAWVRGFDERVDAKHHLVADHYLHNSEARHDSTDSTLSKVDGSFIHKSDDDFINPGCPNWPYIRFLVEFKAGGTKSDPFDDRPLYGPDATAQTRIAVRGQLMHYAERVFAYQHRCKVFLLLINSDRFRVMRWDRSGVAVTESVDYCHTLAGTRALLEVLHAFSRLSRAQQGFDTSAVLLMKNSCGWKRMDLLAEDDKDDLNSAEGVLDGPIHEVFTQPDTAYGSLTYHPHADLHDDPTCECSGHMMTPPVIPVLSHIREMFRDSLKADFPRYRLLVDGQEYLVAKHLFLGFGMVGRGTRGYIALEWKTQRFVFLKDCWRPGYKGVDKEGDILAKLNANGVENIPTIVRYGDVSHTEAGFGVQETEVSHYRPGFVPATGKKREVDKTLPAFEETIPVPTVAEMKFMNFVKEKAYQPKEKPVTRLAASAFPAAPDSEGAGQPAAASPANTAPNLPAFDPTMSPPAPPPPTTKANSKGPRGIKRSYDMFRGKENMGVGLRHMIHTRMVVREIGLPLTAFKSSRQFVRIIYECVTAHATAYKKCGYIHRDISAGNMLIYPEVIPVVFSTPDGNITEEHPLNELISQLLAVFHSRYVVHAWDSAQKKSRTPHLQLPPPTPKTERPTIWETGLKGPEATFGAPPKFQKDKAPQLVEPTPEQRDNLAALHSHSLIAHILHSYFSSGGYEWPEDDVVPDPQAENSTKKSPRRTTTAADPQAENSTKKSPRRTTTAAGTLGKPEVVPVPQANDPEDVPMPDAEENDKLEGGAAVHDVPDVAHSYHDAEDLLTTAPEAELIPEEPDARPAKRRRTTVVQACDTNEPAAGDLPVRRVTRAAAARAQAAAALAAAAAPAPTAAAPLATPAATVVQASTRLTRSKTGKLPKPKTHLTVTQAGASGVPAPKRGGRARSTAADKTQAANKPATRRRAAASQATPKTTGGRRTRR